MPITERTVSTLVKVSAWSALYRMFLHSIEESFGFSYVCLPDAYTPKVKVPCDSQEMKRMFEIGYEMGLEGDSWRSSPQDSS